MKPVHLNQLLFHPQNTTTLSFYQGHGTKLEEFDSFYNDMQIQLSLRGKTKLVKVLEKNKSNIHKILKRHPHKSHGFFFSEKIQGYIVLEIQLESYCMIGNNFHVRPLLEEIFINPEYLVVNVSLYDIKVYRGDFHQLEIIKQYEFDHFTYDMRNRIYTPGNMGLVPYKTILALKTIALEVKDLTHFDSIPVLVTGIDVMKNNFLKYFPLYQGVISQVEEDFYEKSCVEILQGCLPLRPNIMDFYALRFKDGLKKMVKSKRLISELGQIIEAINQEKVIQLVLPTQKKLYGKISFASGDFEIHKKVVKKNASVDILNELAEEVIRQGGKIQILAPHFFPQDVYALAILRG